MDPHFLVSSLLVLTLGVFSDQLGAVIAAKVNFALCDIYVYSLNKAAQTNTRRTIAHRPALGRLGPLINFAWPRSH